MVRIKHINAFFCILIASVAAVGSKINLDLLIDKASIYKQTMSSLAGDTFSEQAIDTIQSLPTKSNVKIIVHGFRGSRSDSSIKPLVNAYLAEGYENVLAADWQSAADLDYHTSRYAVAKVAERFAVLLANFFEVNGVSLLDVHVIGHSLGAHIAGDIGKWFNGSLGRITGLDPALPLFRPLDADSLRPSDATFVDVVHTDYPVFGDLTPRGSIDFYPNFGHATQPGCSEFYLVILSQALFDSYSCSHNRAVLLFAESVARARGFSSVPCSLNGIRQKSLEICRRDRHAAVVAYMGEHVGNRTAGLYYLPTFDFPPFGMGENIHF